MKPLKILLISPLPPPAGGIASWSVGVLRELRQRRDLLVSHVDTAVRWRSSNDRRALSRLIGGTLQALIDSGNVSRSIRYCRPHVLHLCSSASFAAAKDLLVLMMTRSLGIKTVLHYRFGRLPEVIGRGGWEWGLVRRSIQLSDAVIVLDQASADAVKAALPAARVELIPNPFDQTLLEADLEPDAGYREPASRILFAGQVVRAKGIDELVAACSILRLEGVQLQLRLTGQVEAEYREELLLSAHSLGDGDWLTFDGQVTREEAVAAIRRADLFVLPSHTEGFPNVIVEAMAMGRAIVASRVGAIPEMLAEGSSQPCGVVVAPHDITDLADAIRFMVLNPDRAHSMGRAARERVFDCYMLTKVVDRYVHLWSSLTQK